MVLAAELLRCVSHSYWSCDPNTWHTMLGDVERASCTIGVTRLTQFAMRRSGVVGRLKTELNHCVVT